MTRTSKRRSENRRPSRVLFSGLALIALLLAVALFVVRVPGNGVPGIAYKTIYASVSDPGNLQPLSEVRIGGVRVGQVVSVKAQDGRALVKLRLDPGTERIPTDTGAIVRGAGLLGQRFVELVPGKSRQTVPADGVVRGSLITFGIPDALSTFDPLTRLRFTGMLRGLGTGTLGRGDDLNAALKAAPPAGTDFKSIITAVLARPGAASRLVPSLESTARELDASRLTMAHGFRVGSNALQPFVDRHAAFASTFDELPPTLETARDGLRGGEALLQSVKVLADGVNTTLPAAPPALAQTTALLRDSHGPLAQARTLLEQIPSAVPAALAITGKAQPLLTPIRRALHDTTNTAIDLGRHGCDIDELGENWRAMLAYGERGSDAGASAPLPDGNVGPLTSFRITAIANGTALAGISTPGLAPGTQRDAYPQPCIFNNSKYLQVGTTGVRR